MIKLTQLLSYVELTGNGEVSGMAASYFDQGDDYFSEGKEAFVRIAEMPRPHAMNAAEKLLREAPALMPQAVRPYLAMMETALFQALQKRGQW